MITGTDPRTGLQVGTGVAETTPAELDRLASAAADAAPAFGASTPQVRADLLRALADRLVERGPDLVPLAMAETGLPEGRLKGEVIRTGYQLRLFAEVVLEGSYVEAVLDSPNPAAPPGPQPDVRRMLVAIGPVAVFAASNFPFAFSVLGGDTASALAAGCPVIVKAHGSHPSLSAKVGELAAEVVAEAGLPAGVFGVVFGASIGRDLVLHSRVAACGFTGSTAGGRALFDLAGGRPKPIPFYGELGSVNPAVVTPGALAARGAEIVAGYVGSFTLGTGQFCTKPGLLFLPSGHGLGPALAEAVASVASAPMLDERIRDGFVRGVAELAAHEDVATCASGGDAPAEGAWGTPQLFTTHAAAVLSDPAPLTAEYFGPASLIVEYDDVEQLVAALDQVEGSLTATLHAEAEEDFPVPTVLAELQARAGRVIWNGWPTGVAVVWAMQHGGPWPSTTNSLHTSVGATAIRRWLRPVSYQSVPDALLPAALQDANPWGLPRRVDGVLRLK